MKSEDIKKVIEVAQAITSVRDHGECWCSICERDAATIKANPTIADLVGRATEKTAPPPAATD